MAEEKYLDVSALAKEVNRLRAIVQDMRNELCEHCGKYRYAYDGACDDCRWRDV